MRKGDHPKAAVLRTHYSNGGARPVVAGIMESVIDTGERREVCVWK
ncbi:MAG: hypothetical protein WD645_00565 [Dehalococcoidia bacterium]